MAIEGSDLCLTVPDTLEAVPVLVMGQNNGSHQPLSIHGVIDGPVHIGQRVPLKAVELCLANFSYLLPPHQYLGGQRAIRVDPVRWESDGWTITITAVSDVSRLVEEVKAVGGYILTHRVKIERSDSACFSIDEATSLIERLRRFLCFAQGCYVNLILPVGYDAAGEVVWQMWGPWHVSRWKYFPSWVDKWYANQIGDAFKGFTDRCKNSSWSDTLDQVLYWHVESNLCF